MHTSYLVNYVMKLFLKRIGGGHTNITTMPPSLSPRYQNKIFLSNEIGFN